MSTLRMSRELSAPPEVVFDYLTRHDHLLNWWGPEGTTIADNNIDFSRKGPWHATMVGPQGHGARVVGEVRRVDPPRAVELTLAFDLGSQGLGPESVILFELTATDTGTRLDLTQSGLDPDHIEDMRNKGWNSALGRLIALVNAS